MSGTNSVLAGLTAALILAPCQAAGQDVVGRVLEDGSGAAVAAAIVTLTTPSGEVAGATLSDAAGGFSLSPLDPGPGEYRIRVERAGYVPAEAGIQIGAGELNVEIFMAVRAFPVEAVLVREERRDVLAEVGFQQRREAGNGIFVDRQEIDRRKPQQITELLRARSVVRVVPMGTGEDLRVQGSGRRFQHPDCQPAIWIDGSQVRSAGNPQIQTWPTGSKSNIDPPLSELISPHDIEGMEVYARSAGLPIQFRGSNVDCGVVLIWTRRD